MSVNRYNAQLQDALDNYADKFKTSTLYIIEDISPSIGGNNYSVPQLPSYAKTLKENKELLYFEIEGFSDYSKTPYALAYSNEIFKLWRTYYPSNEKDILRKKIEQLKLNLLQNPMQAKKINYLLEHTKRRLQSLLEHEMLSINFLGYYLKPSSFENGLYIDQKAYRLHLKVATQNKNGGYGWFVFDISALRGIIDGIIETILLDALYTLIISAVIIIFAINWLINPLVRLSKSINQDITQIKPQEIPYQQRHDEIGVFARRFKKLLERTQENMQALKNYNTKLSQQVNEEVQKYVTLEEEKKQQEKLLYQKSKTEELGTMIGYIAHQWKQPLNAIGIVIQRLPEFHAHNELNKEKITTLSNTIFERVNFLNQTIDDFREFFKPDKEKKRFFVCDATEKIVDIIQPVCTKNNITLSIHAKEDVEIFGFANEYKQVIMNIINNAIDAISTKKQAGKITLKILHNKSYVHILIQDNGVGIEKELLPSKIFIAHSSTKGRKGSGLGLSLSRLIMEKNFYGTIKAYNEKEGALFHLTIPRYQVDNNVS